MISVDTKATLESLRRHIEDVTRRLENAVKGLAYEFTLAASKNTPVGDPAKYYELYKYRFNEYGIPEQAGFHRGAWSIETNDTFDFDNTIRTVEPSLQMGLTGYRLGMPLYIGASGPAYGYLNSGKNQQVPMGITKPTMRDIEVIYKTDIAKYFNQ